MPGPRHSKQRVLDFIAKSIASNGEAPTMSEIGKQIGTSSTGAVSAILTTLEREGSIRRTRQWRGIEIVKQSPPMVGWLDR